MKSGCRRSSSSRLPPDTHVSVTLNTGSSPQTAQQTRNQGTYSGKYACETITTTSASLRCYWSSSHVTLNDVSPASSFASSTSRSKSSKDVLGPLVSCCRVALCQGHNVPSQLRYRIEPQRIKKLVDILVVLQSDLMVSRFCAPVISRLAPRRRPQRGSDHWTKRTSAMSAAWIRPP